MHRTANAAALGYAAFALALWMSSMVPAGWFEHTAGAGLLALLMVALGGCVLAIAGVLQWARGNSLDAFLFIAFAAYWWVASLPAFGIPAAALLRTSANFLGWYDMVWAVLAFCAWFAAYRDGVARMLFALGLCLSLFAAALAKWSGIDAVAILGGYLGLVSAIVGIYIAAAEIVNATHGHTVLPLGEAAPAGGAGATAGSRAER